MQSFYVPAGEAPSSATGELATLESNALSNLASMNGTSFSAGAPQTLSFTTPTGCASTIWSYLEQQLGPSGPSSGPWSSYLLLSEEVPALEQTGSWANFVTMGYEFSPSAVPSTCENWTTGATVQIFSLGSQTIASVILDGAAPATAMMALPTNTQNSTGQPIPSTLIFAPDVSIGGGDVGATDLTGVTTIQLPNMQYAVCAVSPGYNEYESLPNTFTVPAPGGPALAPMDLSLNATGTTPPSSFDLDLPFGGTGGGTVSWTPDDTGSCGQYCFVFPAGTALALTESPYAGSVFTGWSGACSGTGACTVTMNSNQSLGATFNLTPGGGGGGQYTLTVSVTGTGSGSVTSTPAGISCPGTCSASFASGAGVTLTSTPASGSAFAGWSGTCSGTGACSVTMNSNQSVTAMFNLGLQIGVNGGNVLYGAASVSCTNSGGFFDNCTGSVSLSIPVGIMNGELAVAMDQASFAGGTSYASGAVPGTVSISLSWGIIQGSCVAGTTNTDIQVYDGFVNSSSTYVEIGSSVSVPLVISCGSGT
ncbi:MAG: hypothetical protein ABSF46_01445 [Terriglobia bacterium]